MEISCPRRGMQYDILHPGKSMIGNNNAEKNTLSSLRIYRPYK